ncbi:hypothetical protein FHG68_00800 [Leptospira weilii]|nr:hypothetical protein FHG67_00790 [Leptospira weilii]QDK25419.1 hypothetical protein FHG68_00800 [Leptospira weilii]
MLPTGRSSPSTQKLGWGPIVSQRICRNSDRFIFGSHFSNQNTVSYIYSIKLIFYLNCGSRILDWNQFFRKVFVKVGSRLVS